MIYIYIFDSPDKKVGNILLVRSPQYGIMALMPLFLLVSKDYPMIAPWYPISILHGSVKRPFGFRVPQISSTSR